MADAPKARTMSTESKCPFSGARTTVGATTHWWPDQLNVKLLHQHSSLSNPMGEALTTPRRSRPSISMP